MNYRASIKQQLMGGKLYKVRGFGISAGSGPQMQLNHYHSGGTTSGGTFGGNLTYTNNIEKFVKIAEGRYNNFIVTIVDQNNNDITILDNNLLINFLIRVK